LRVFAFAPTMMPKPPALEAAPLSAMARFADLAHEAGVTLLPTPLVGHMSGENYGFAAQGERSLYTDGELRSWQTALVRGVVGALADKPNVAAWILTNEMPLWAGAVGLSSGAPASDIVEWARAMTAVVREADASRPIGTGDGMMSGWPTR